MPFLKTSVSTVGRCECVHVRLHTCLCLHNLQLSALHTHKRREAVPECNALNNDNANSQLPGITA